MHRHRPLIFVNARVYVGERWSILLIDSIGSEEVIKVIQGISSGVEQNISFLTNLDQATGDGDHGINLGRGFRAVRAKLHEIKGKDVGNTLKIVGQILISNVGGAAGPLFGTAFMRAGEAAMGKDKVDLKTVALMFDAAERGIVEIGKASLGEKTMLDAIHPAVLAVRQAAEKGKSLLEGFELAVSAAHDGMQNTTNMISKRGRSSYLMERSRGHKDVGATSTYIMLKSALDILRTLQ